MSGKIDDGRKTNVFHMKSKAKYANKPINAIACLILMILLVNLFGMLQDADADELSSYEVIEEAEYVLLEDAEEAFPVISSVGKENIKAGGVKSKGSLIRYTIPEALLRADPVFLKLMTEAEKYIGYPYVYGASRPKDGFDCAGFVCYVFRNSGVYKMKNRGANGLHDLCKEVDAEDARPGDLVFFKDTMGRKVKGITHVGIYVGNGMMIHAGDPVGFADICSDQWSKKLVCYGRLPIN